MSQPNPGETKNLLAQTFKTLMSERQFSKITVTDICDRCHMNRKSFYYHFRDKYDLVNWIFTTEFIDTLDLSGDIDVWWVIQSMCKYFFAGKKFYINALKSEEQNSFRDHLRNFLYDLMKESRAVLSLTEKQAAFFARFFCDAALISIERWITCTSDVSPDEYVELLKCSMITVSKFMPGETHNQ